MCGVDADVNYTHTLLVGSAGGELVVLREELVGSTDEMSWTDEMFLGTSNLIRDEQIADF